MTYAQWWASGYSVNLILASWIRSTYMYTGHPVSQPILVNCFHRLSNPDDQGLIYKNGSMTNIDSLNRYSIFNFRKLLFKEL